MTHHDQEHPEERADELERRTEQLGEEIEDAREDWERKKADPQVPGAAGDPAAADSDDQPETDYPTKRDPAEDL